MKRLAIVAIFSLVFWSATAADQMSTTGIVKTGSFGTRDAKANAVLRFLGPGNDHLYTKDCYEGKLATINSHYVYEGIAFFVLANQEEGTSPLWRFRGPGGDRVLTSDSNQKKRLESNGYTDEGVIGYVFTAPHSGSTPLFRSNIRNVLVNFYTIDKDEHNNAVAHLGHVDGGVGDYVLLNGHLQCGPEEAYFGYTPPGSGKHQCVGYSDCGPGNELIICRSGWEENCY